MDNEKKYPVLYYDLSTTDVDIVAGLSKQLTEYFQKEKVPFILLPKDIMELKWLSKEETLEHLRNIIKEVEEWQ
jgi:hypothetical protein